MQCQSETNWGLVIILLGLIALMCVLAASAQTDSVYDLGIDGEVVKQCFTQIEGNHIVFIVVGAGGDCYKVMNWFMDHGYKHTGEIIGSEWNYGAFEGWESKTKYLVLTR